MLILHAGLKQQRAIRVFVSNTVMPNDVGPRGRVTTNAVVKVPKQEQPVFERYGAYDGGLALIEVFLIVDSSSECWCISRRCWSCS